MVSPSVCFSVKEMSLLLRSTGDVMSLFIEGGGGGGGLREIDDAFAGISCARVGTLLVSGGSCGGGVTLDGGDGLNGSESFKSGKEGE